MPFGEIVECAWRFELGELHVQQPNALSCGQVRNSRYRRVPAMPGGDVFIHRSLALHRLLGGDLRRYHRVHSLRRMFGHLYIS